MYSYRIYEEERIIGKREYQSFGVAAFDRDGEIAACVPDITSVKEKAELLAMMCEKYCLSPVHLKDIAEDFIVSDLY